MFARNPDSGNNVSFTGLDAVMSNQKLFHDKSLERGRIVESLNDVNSREILTNLLKDGSLSDDAKLTLKIADKNNPATVVGREKQILIDSILRQDELAVKVRSRLLSEK